MADLLLRPRTVTELVDASFRLYRQNFVPLVTLSTIVHLPFAVLVLVMLFVSGGVSASPDSIAALAVGGVATILMVPILVGAIIWYPLMRTALMVSASETYLGREIDAGGAIKAVTARSGKVIAAWYAKWIIIIAGFIALVVPGFYFIVRYFAVPATVVLENNGVGAGLRRSAQLASGHKWKILGTLALGWMLLFAMQFTVSMLVMIVVLISTLRGGDPMDAQSSMLVQLPQIAAYILGLPLMAVLETLLYYDMRIRQEGFDIEVMSAQLVATAPDAAIG